MLAEEAPFDLIYERYSLWSNAGMHFAKTHHCVGILEVNAPLIEEQKKHRELPLENEAQAIAESVFSHADAMIAVPRVNIIGNIPTSPWTSSCHC